MLIFIILPKIHINDNNNFKLTHIVINSITSVLK